MHKFLDQANRLRDVPRFSTYNLEGMQENVAEHSYYVSLITVLICSLLSEKGVVIDRGRALTKAVMHDVEETFISDIISPIKKHLSDIHWVASGKITDWLRETFPDNANLRAHYFWMWEHARCMDIEGEVVLLADQLAVLLFLQRRSTKDGDKIVATIRNTLTRTINNTKNPKLKEVLDHILEEPNGNQNAEDGGTTK